MTGANCSTRRDEAGARGSAGVRVSLSVRRLERSIAFYRHVLGYRVVADARHEQVPCVIMAAHDQVCLRLEEKRRLTRPDGSIRGAEDGPKLASAKVSRHPANHLSLSVIDLDEARASLWDEGVPLATGTREPAGAGQAMRSLFIDDPDGHRIELVEKLAEIAPPETGTS